MLFWQLFSSYMYIEKAAKMTLCKKFVHKMLMKLSNRFLPELLNVTMNES